MSSTGFVRDIFVSDSKSYETFPPLEDDTITEPNCYCKLSPGKQSV